MKYDEVSAKLYEKCYAMRRIGMRTSSQGCQHSEYFMGCTVDESI